MSEPIRAEVVAESRPKPTAHGVCTKCGYVGLCDVEAGLLRHWRPDGRRCGYAAFRIPGEDEKGGGAGSSLHIASALVINYHGSELAQKIAEAIDEARQAKQQGA